MRNISEEMQARLDTGVTFLCRCWLVERRDGVRFGFTDHDHDLSFEGMQYIADSGLDASVLETSTGLSVDNAQALGALRSDSITEVDIMAGKFDGAKVSHWLVDWQDTALRSLLFRGFLGEIQRGEIAFEAELRGLSEALNQPLGRNYLRVCDRILGDDLCGVDIEDPTVSAHVELMKSEAGRSFSFIGLAGFEPQWFVNGSVKWLSGEVSLIKADRLLDGVRVLEFWEEIRLPVTNGEIAQVIAGCDKRAGTCGKKFNNFLNFRGFPHMPGEDWVTAYPTSEKRNEGQSLTHPVLESLFDD